MVMNDKEEEELIEENKHIFELRDDIGEVCDGHYLGDIETAIIMFLSDMYEEGITSRGARMEQVGVFCARLIMVIKTFDDFNANDDSRNLQ